MKTSLVSGNTSSSLLRRRYRGIHPPSAKPTLPRPYPASPRRQRPPPGRTAPRPFPCLRVGARCAALGRAALGLLLSSALFPGQVITPMGSAAGSVKAGAATRRAWP